MEQPGAARTAGWHCGGVAGGLSPAPWPPAGGPREDGGGGADMEQAAWAGLGSMGVPGPRPGEKAEA